MFLRDPQSPKNNRKNNRDRWLETIPPLNLFHDISFPIPIRARVRVHGHDVIIDRVTKTDGISRRGSMSRQILRPPGPCGSQSTSSTYCFHPTFFFSTPTPHHCRTGPRGPTRTSHTASPTTRPATPPPVLLAALTLVFLSTMQSNCVTNARRPVLPSTTPWLPAGMRTAEATRASARPAPTRSSSPADPWPITSPTGSGPTE